MNSRERFLKTVHFEKTDRLFLFPQWIFKAAKKRWQSEGMPKDVHYNTFFGFDRYEEIPINFGLIPAPEEVVIEEDAQTATYKDEMGFIIKKWKNKEGMYHWLEYGLKKPEDWTKFKERLNPKSPARYPEHWEDLKKSYANRDYPLGIMAGSFYGWLRDWIGMENIALMYYDNPGFLKEATNYIADYFLEVIERAASEVDLDFAFFWEDMAMKTGPLISPALFKEFMVPCYKRVTSFLRKRGVDTFLVDCDGHIDELIPLWLEGGVNGVYPLEVAAGCDALKYREKYGKELILMGNIDKRALRGSKEAVEKEVMSKVPQLFAGSGYIPMIDHSVPEDVSYENFTYYLNLVKSVKS